MVKITMNCRCAVNLSRNKLNYRMYNDALRLIATDRLTLLNRRFRMRERVKRMS